MGEQVPSPWPELNDIVDIRTRDAITVIGAPGSNKSNLLLNWTIKNDIPTIYGSFDTPVGDMTARSLAILSGDTINKVFEGIGHGTYTGYAMQQLNFWFEDDTRLLDPFLNTLETKMDALYEAFKEFLGEPPKVFVLDNLSDVSNDLDPKALQRTFKAARNAAHRLNVAVFALHHNNRQSTDGQADPSQVPLKLTDGVGAGERDAAVVLGVYKPKRDEGRVLRVSSLKCKRAEADPAGGIYADLELDQERASIG